MERIKFSKEYFTILIATILLFTIGIIMISSSSTEYARRYFDDSFYLLKKHLLHAMAGIVVLAFVMNIPFNKYQYLSYLLIFVNIILLILVLIPEIGFSAGGSRSWIDLGIFSLQPSEFAKISLIIFASDILVRKKKSINRFIHLVIPLLLISAIITYLIFLQPDLGTAVIIWLSLFVILFTGKVKFRHLLLILIIWLLIVGLYITKAEYRMERITSFLSEYSGEDTDTNGDNYQLKQALIALGSGGIFGKGLGKSIQKLAYLPNSHTDFIFAIIGEELGLIGSLFVVVLYLVFAIAGMSLCLRTKNQLGKLLAVGITIYIVGQALIKDRKSVV